MRAGVAHRDIKIDNILVDPASLLIKLIDYGLATIDEELDENTLDNAFVGTPIYMAPEILGKRGCYNVIASELYSAGIVFWTLLRGGEHPFRVCS